MCVCPSVYTAHKCICTYLHSVMPRKRRKDGDDGAPIINEVVCACVCVCVYIYIYIYVCIYIFVCVYIYIYIYIYIHVCKGAPIINESCLISLALQSVYGYGYGCLT